MAYNAEHVAQDIADWHHDRNLIQGSDDKAQFTKLMEEAGELAGAISRGQDVEDHIGDMVVVLINIAARNNTTLGECMGVAWEEIKDRKGRMIDGIFVKEADLEKAS